MGTGKSLTYQICHWLNRPFVRPKQHGRASYEEYAQYEYEMAHHTLEELKPIALAGKTVLDIGCGMGGKSVYLAQQGVQKLIAVDIEPKRLQTGRDFAQKHTLSPDTIEFIQADARQLPFDNDAFDVVVANDSFEHLFDLEDTIRECYRVLKPGGMLGFNLLPYRSRDGAHLYDYVFIPWCQYVLPEKWIVAYWKAHFIEDYHAGKNRILHMTPDELADVTTIKDLAHLNKLSLKAMKTMLAHTGFQPVREERLCSQKLGFLKDLPVFNEFVTYAYKAVYTKPAL